MQRQSEERQGAGAKVRSDKGSLARRGKGINGNTWMHKAVQEPLARGYELKDTQRHNPVRLLVRTVPHYFSP